MLHILCHTSIERAQLSPMPQEKSLLNPLNPCEPSPTHKSEIRVSLKCPPTSVRFNTLKSKTCEICGIRVSPNPTHKSEIRVSQAAHAHKSGDSCEEKGSEGGVGTTSFGAFP